MVIPDGLTEEDVLRIIEDIAAKLSPKLTFGFISFEDLQQEGRLIALEGILKFNAYHEGISGLDTATALEHFLRVHVTNRLKTLKRNHMGRLEKPASAARIGAWEERNRVKRQLMYPENIDNVGHSVCNVRDEHESIYYNEVMELINLYLPAGLRSDFLRMRDGVKIPAQRQLRVRECIAEILDRPDLLAVPEETLI